MASGDSLIPIINQFLTENIDLINGLYQAKIQEYRLDPLLLNIPNHTLSSKDLLGMNVEGTIQYDDFSILGLKKGKIEAIKIIGKESQRLNSSMIHGKLVTKITTPLAVSGKGRLIGTTVIEKRENQFQLKLSTNLSTDAKISTIRASLEGRAELHFDFSQLKITKFELTDLQITYENIRVNVNELGPFSKYLDEIVAKITQVFKGEIEKILNQRGEKKFNQIIAAALPITFP